MPNLCCQSASYSYTSYSGYYLFGIIDTCYQNPFFILLYYIRSPLSSDYSINNHRYPSIFNNCVIHIDPLHRHDNI